MFLEKNQKFIFHIIRVITIGLEKYGITHCIIANLRTTSDRIIILKITYYNERRNTKSQESHKFHKNIISVASDEQRISTIIFHKRDRGIHPIYIHTIIAHIPRYHATT